VIQKWADYLLAGVRTGYTPWHRSFLPTFPEGASFFERRLNQKTQKLREGHSMKRFFVFAALGALAMFGSSLLVAQNDPNIGTWKLNVAKSKFSPGPAPQSQTRTVVAQGAGVKVTMEGTAGDGSHIAYGYAGNYDGKDNPITGTGQASGADTIALKRSGNTFEVTMKKGGKVLTTNKNVVSKHGKVLTITAKGTNASGQPVSNVIVFDKQ
jgi:hypothetical protein